MTRRIALRTVTNYLKTTPYPFRLSRANQQSQEILVEVFSVPQSAREGVESAYYEFRSGVPGLAKYDCYICVIGERPTVVNYPQFATPDAVASVYRMQATELTEVKADRNAFGAQLREAQDALKIAQARAKFHGQVALSLVVGILVAVVVQLF